MCVVSCSSFSTLMSVFSSVSVDNPTLTPAVRRVGVVTRGLQQGKWSAAEPRQGRLASSRQS